MKGNRRTEKLFNGVLENILLGSSTHRREQWEKDSVGIVPPRYIHSGPFCQYSRRHGLFRPLSEGLLRRSRPPEWQRVQKHPEVTY